MKGVGGMRRSMSVTVDKNLQYYDWLPYAVIVEQELVQFLGVGSG